MTETTITDQQLASIKQGYVSSILNSVSVGVLVQIAAAKLSEDYATMGAQELRDAIISQNDITVWNQLIENVQKAEEEKQD